MQKNESHAVRNGVIATVIGGILLSFWPPFIAFLKKGYIFLCDLFKSLYGYLSSEHQVYGWLIILMSLLSVILLGIILSNIKKSEPGVEDLYTEDYLFGVNWQWAYIFNDIEHLWCLCPTCKSELIYSQFIPEPFNYRHEGLEPFTEFICENCGNITKTKLKGDKEFALSTVKREIRRKIRTDEWKK